MLSYRQFPVPSAFTSDGCTVPWFIWFMREVMAPYKAACRWHDWARRHLVHYRVLTPAQADKQYRLFLRDMDAGWWLANAAWLFVSATRWYYRETEPVSNSWTAYLNPIKLEKSQ